MSKNNNEWIDVSECLPKRDGFYDCVVRKHLDSVDRDVSLLLNLYYCVENDVWIHCPSRRIYGDDIEYIGESKGLKVLRWQKNNEEIMLSQIRILMQQVIDACDLSISDKICDLRQMCGILEYAIIDLEKAKREGAL